MIFKANSANHLPSSLILKSAIGADFLKKIAFYINLANELPSLTRVEIGNDFRNISMNSVTVKSASPMPTFTIHHPRQFADF